MDYPIYEMENQKKCLKPPTIDMVFIPRLYHINMNCLKPPTRDSCLMFMYPSLEHLELHPR